ncbi:MAG: extracellular solute-binding protein [Pleomorphochaeta sp.]
MKKKLFIVLTIVMMLSTSLVFAGGDSEKNESGSPEIVVSNNFIGNPDGTIELNWQPNPYHWLTNASESKKAYLEPRVKEWLEAHPDVKINVMDTSTSIADAMAKTLVQSENGQLPDMASIDSYMFPKFHKYVQPLNDALSANNIEQDDFFEYVQKTTVDSNGDIKGLWYTTDVRFLYYRKDLIKNPPKTWDELLAVCEDIKDDVEEPINFEADRDEGTLTATILPWLYGDGGKLFDGETPVFGEANNKETLVNSMNFVKELLEKGYAPSSILTSNIPAFFPQAAAGQVGMFIGGNFSKNQFIGIIGEDTYNELWDVAQIPMPKEGQRSSIAGGWVSAVFTDDSVKKDLCEDFLIWMYGSDDGMSGWCAAGGYLPTRTSVFNNDPYFNSTEFMKACRTELATSSVRPAAALYSEASNEILAAYGDVLTNKMSAEEGVDLAFNNVVKLTK